MADSFLYALLKAGSGLPLSERGHGMLAALPAAAMAATGATAAAVGLWDENAGKLVLRHATHPEIPEAAVTMAGALGHSWRSGEVHYGATASDLEPDALRLVQTVGATGVVLIPVCTSSQCFGVLLLFVQERSQAAEETVLVMAEECAAALAYEAVASENRQLIRRLQQTSSDLDRANRAKSEFLANMSHELRTPLNAVIGYSEFLIEDAMQMDPETNKTFLENILTSGHDLLRLINDILDLSKVDAGRMELHPEDFLLFEAVQSVHAVIKPLADKRQQRLELQVDPAVGIVFHDSGRMKHVLYNLLSNAVKFTPDRGTIRTTARLGAEGWFEVAVSDTGIGIRPEDLDQIFAEFQQIDSGYARAQGGSGLGLSLVRRFTHLMGGQVHVESKLGAGSTFTLRLPLRQAQPKPIDLPTGEGPLVLVVEDEPNAASLLQLHLTRSGYQVERASTAAQALDKARLLRPAAITLDIILPDEDGWHVLRKLRSDPQTKEIPVVVVSMVDDPGIARASGADAHLVKPVDPRGLLTTVNSLVRKG